MGLKVQLNSQFMNHMFPNQTKHVLSIHSKKYWESMLISMESMPEVIKGDFL